MLDYEDYMALYLYPPIDLWLIWGTEVTDNHDPVFLLMELRGISSYTIPHEGDGGDIYLSQKFVVQNMSDSKFIIGNESYY